MFKPNDKVLCISVKPCEVTKLLPLYIREGSTYTVSDTVTCCMQRIALKEFPDSSRVLPNYSCICGDKNSFGYYGWRFIKLAGDDVVTEEKGELEDFIRQEVEKII